jgi:hypothetical protein
MKQPTPDITPSLGGLCTVAFILRLSRFDNLAQSPQVLKTPFGPLTVKEATLASTLTSLVKVRGGRRVDDGIMTMMMMMMMMMKVMVMIMMMFTSFVQVYAFAAISTCLVVTGELFSKTSLQSELQVGHHNRPSLTIKPYVTILTFFWGYWGAALW